MKAATSFFVLSFIFYFGVNAEVNLQKQQLQQKQDFERAQSFHRFKMRKSLFARPTRVLQEKKETQNVSSFTQKTQDQAKGLYEKAQAYLYKNLQKYGVSDFYKRSLRSIKGIKSNPPTISDFRAFFITAGLSPEVLWFVGSPADSDGTVDRFEFNFGDGTSVVVPYADFDTGSSTISHIYLSSGTYTASVKIVDNSGDFSTYTHTMTVTNNNKSPVPKFSLQTNQSPNFLKVDFFSQATDSDGSLGYYSWYFGDNSAGSSGVNATTATRTYEGPGIYNIWFQVTDNQQAIAGAGTQVYVGQTPPGGGSPPVPVVVADTFAGVAPLTVGFDGESSFDIEGTVESYEWDFGDFYNPRNKSNLSKPSYKYTQPGSYHGSLKVTDNGGRVSTRYFSVYVLPSSGINTISEILSIPQAAARTFSFDSNYFSIHAPALCNYQIWNFGDSSPIAKGCYPTHTYAANGTYTVTLKTYDVRGQYQMVQKQLVVTSDQSAPNNYFIADKSSIITNENVQFITQNTSAVGSQTSAIWDFGDGTRQVGLHQNLLSVTHAYAQKGFYPVTLTVTDINGKSNQYTQTIVVQASDGPVNVVIKASQKMGPIPFPVRLDAGDSTSTAGVIEKYYWIIYSDAAPLYTSKKIMTPSFVTGGEKYVVLYIEDSVGNIGVMGETLVAIDPTQIPVNNQAPVGVINISYPNPLDASSFKFDAYQSSDPDGDRIAQYEWFLDGSPINGIYDVYAQVPQNGNHTISLRVTDRWGTVAETKKTFEKRDSQNQIISFISAPEHPIPGTNVYFLADETTLFIPGATIKEIGWDFGDGKTDCCANRVNHTFAAVGTYLVQMKVKDSNNQIHTATMNLVVESATSPNVVITAEDSREIIENYGTQNFQWERFPVEVKFDLNKRSTSQGYGLKDAVWNFGDGNTGFGLNPTYSFQKPGTYNVTVSATDVNGQVGTSNMQVIIGNVNCMLEDGIEGCLQLNNSQGHVWPMSASEWVVGHDLGTNLDWDPDVNDTEYATLTTADENSPTTYNITSAVVVDGPVLRIQKQTLVNLGVNLNKGYELRIGSLLSDNSDYYASFPAVYFGIGTINVTANEDQVRLTISGSKGYKKYLDLGSNLTATIADLPNDTYTILAEKGDRQLNYDVTISNSTAQNLSVDLSSANIKKEYAKWKKEAARRKALPRGKFSETFVKGPGVTVRNEQRNYPTWAYDPCGNRAPFKLAEDMKPLPEGKEYDNLFWSADPDAQEDFFTVTKAYQNELQVICGIASETNHYPVTAWRLRDGSKRCGGPDAPHPDWNYYKSIVEPLERHPIKINVTFRDAMTSQTEAVTQQFTLQQLMREEHVTRENITSKTGISYRPDIWLWGLKKKIKIPIPKGYKKPQASITLESHHHPTTGNGDYGTYVVGCAIEREVVKYPRVEEISAVEGAASLPINYSPKYNGLQFMDKNLFPAHTAQHVPEAVDLYKARIQLLIDYGNLLYTSIDKVKMVVKYRGAEVGTPIIYNLDPLKTFPVEGKSQMTTEIEMNAADWNNWVQFQQNVDEKVELQFYPMGPEFVDDNAKPKIFSFDPLFNLNHSSLQTEVCKNGIYGSDSNKILSYTKANMINRMMQMETAHQVGFRCNDASLPWGGPYQIIPGLGGWAHAGHQRGEEVDIRYFNENATKQDEYDINDAQKRLNDLNVYMKFSEWAKNVSEDSGLILKKQEIYAFCMGFNSGGVPKSPCNFTTQESDLTHSLILKICQWHDVGQDVCNPSNASDWRTAIIRYFYWAKKNNTILNNMETNFEYLMSGGKARPFYEGSLNILKKSKEWQTQAIDFGLWPDQESIYNVSGSNILDTKIQSCSSSFDCGLGIHFGPENKQHFHHIHLELRN